MSHVRGYFASNVLVGFILLLGGILLADLVTHYCLQEPWNNVAYPFALSTCVSPFAAFTLWTLRSDLPLWKIWVSLIVAFVGCTWVEAISNHFNAGHGWLYIVLVFSWLNLWGIIVIRWMRIKLRSDIPSA